MEKDNKFINISDNNIPLPLMNRKSEKNITINSLTSNYSIYKGSLILVNENYPYREEPGSEEMYQVGNEVSLRKTPALLLEKLLNRLGNKDEIIPLSGFRSMKEQKCIFDESMRLNGEEYTRSFVACPSHSEHQTGLAIDLARNEENINFITPDFPSHGIFKKFKYLASSFGFIKRYQGDKKHITGIEDEPWHFRYVGVPHARIMEENGMCLEEYHDFIKQYSYPMKGFIYKYGESVFLIYYLNKDFDFNELKENLKNSVPMVSGNNMDGYILTIRKGVDFNGYAY